MGKKWFHYLKQQDFSGTNFSCSSQTHQQGKKLIFSLSPHLTHRVSIYETNCLDATVDAEFA